MCDNKYCSNCGQDVHPACPTIDIDGITHLLNERMSHIKTLIMKTATIENELVLTV